MGENLDLSGRMAVRTPMQWTDDPGAGFSPARKLVAPVVSGGFGPEHVNVTSSRHDPDSLLQHITLMAQRYRECPELGWGEFEVLDQPHHAVLAHRCTWDEASMVLLHNLGAEPVVVPVTLEDDGGTELVDLLQDGRCRLDEKGRAELALDGYGYRWLRVMRPGDRRLT